VAIRAVLFDVGGVLEITAPTGWIDRWARRLGCTSASLEQRLDRLWRGGETGAVPLSEIERRTAETLDLDAAALAELMGDAWAEYLGSLNRELADYFSRLRHRCRTAILSNSFVGAREREQEAYGFEDLCDAIFYSHELGLLKPDPAIYRVACERLGVRPQEALLLDDLQANVDGARAVGMRAITFTSNAQAISAMEAEFSRTS
jgi:epoxide hydrolase-like predicted phosphatase